MNKLRSLRFILMVMTSCFDFSLYAVEFHVTFVCSQAQTFNYSQKILEQKCERESIISQQLVDDRAQKKAMNKKNERMIAWLTRDRRLSQKSYAHGQLQKISADNHPVYDCAAWKNDNPDNVILEDMISY